MMSFNFFYLAIFIKLVFLITVKCDEFATTNDFIDDGIYIIPRHYVIKVIPHIIPGNFTFDGVVEITSEVLKNTTEINLHIKNIQHKQISITSNGADIEIAHSIDDEFYQLLRITLTEILIAHTKVTIKIVYSGELTDDKNGFYRNYYIDHLNNTKWFAVSNLEPRGARKMFPCFDEPAMRATFQLSVFRTGNFHSVSISKLNFTFQEAGYYIDVFETTPNLPTHAVSLIVSDVGTNENMSKYFNWTNDNDNHEAVFVHLKNDPEQINYFREFYRHKNQLENWGMVTYDNFTIITNPDYTPVALKISFAMDMGYQVAREEFFNKISPRTWNDVSVNIGFARYFTLSNTHCQSQSYLFQNMERFIVEKLQPSLEIDALASAPALVHDMSNSNELLLAFDTYLSAKSTAIVRMFQSILREHKFDPMIITYFDENQQQLLSIDGFYSVMEKLESAVDIISRTPWRNMIDSWTKQSGYPVLHVKIQNGIALLRQEEFSLNFNSSQKSQKIWWIPVTWTSSLQGMVSVSKGNFHNIEPQVWLHTLNKNIPIDVIDENGWIIFNIQQSGYYRVNYDHQSWSQIIKALKSNDFNVIDATNRASIIDDLFNLARAGYVEYGTVLSATQYLTAEENYIPWKAAFNNFAFLYIKITDENIRALLENHILTIIQPIYEKLGFEDKNDDEIYSTLLRNNLLEWACKLGHYDCVDKSLKIFHNSQWCFPKLIPVNYRQTIYCTAIRYGLEENWNFLYNQFFETNIQSEKNTIINGLACTKNNEKMYDLLSIAISENRRLKYEDRLNIISSVAVSGAFGAEVLITFIDKHYDDIDRYIKDLYEIKKILNGILSQLETETSISQFEDCVKNHYDKLKPIEKYLTSSIGNAYEVLKWQNTYSADIFHFLEPLYSRYGYHLQKTVNPISYKIKLTPNFDCNFTFDGNTQIQLIVQADTSVLVLHANDMNISDISVVLISRTLKIIVSRYKFDGHHKLIIYLDTVVPTNSELRLSIDYTVNMSSQVQDGFRLKKSASPSVVQIRKYASQVFPCFDDKTFLAKFKITIQQPQRNQTIPERNHTLNNMKLLVFDEYRDMYVANNNISPQHLTFVLTFDQQNITINDELQVEKFQEIQKSLEIAEKTLSYLEIFSNIWNPLGEITFRVYRNSSISDKSHQSIIDFQESELLIGRKSMPTIVAKNIVSAIIHSAAKMWFQKVAQAELSWEKIWLNEEFARYMHWFAADYFGMKFVETFTVDEVQPALLKDSLIRPTTNQHNNEFTDVCDINQDDMDSKKIVSILRMIQHAFGEINFRNGVKQYLQENQNKPVKLSDLFIAIESKYNKWKIAQRPKKPLMMIVKSWINRSGYPVVYASLSGKNLTLTQNRFLIGGKNLSCEAFYRIPITIATKSNSEFTDTLPKLWFEDHTIVTDSLNINNEWFVLNVQQTGFYRVNYDLRNWNNLINALNQDNFDDISNINRAQIIDDLLNLARADYISYDLALNATKYLSKERNYLPWKAFFNGISYLYDRFDGYDVNTALKKYILMLIQPIYKEVGFEDKDGDYEMDKLTQNLIISWACKLGHTDCLNKSRKLFDDWRNGIQKKLSPNVKQTVFCAAIKFGNSSDWQFLWEKYLESQLEHDKIMILHGLGCSQNATIINNYMNTAISRNGLVDDRHVLLVFESVYSAEKFGVNLTMAFVKDRYKRVSKFFGDSKPIAYLVSQIAARMSMPYQKTRLLRFANTKPTEPTDIRKSYSESVTGLVMNLEWHANHSVDIERWLTKESKNISTSVSSTLRSNSAMLHPLDPLQLLIVLGLIFINIFFCIIKYT